MTIKGKSDEQHRYVTAMWIRLGAIVRLSIRRSSQNGPYRWFPWNMIEGELLPVHVASTGQKVSGTISSTKLLAMSIKDTWNCRTHARQYGSSLVKVTNEKEILVPWG